MHRAIWLCALCVLIGCVVGQNDTMGNSTVTEIPDAITGHCLILDSDFDNSALIEEVVNFFKENPSEVTANNFYLDSDEEKNITDIPQCALFSTLDLDNMVPVFYISDTENIIQLASQINIPYLSSTVSLMQYIGNLSSINSYCTSRLLPVVDGNSTSATVWSQMLDVGCSMIMQFSNTSTTSVSSVLGSITSQVMSSNNTNTTEATVITSSGETVTSSSVFDQQILQVPETAQAYKFFYNLGTSLGIVGDYTETMTPEAKTLSTTMNKIFSESGISDKLSSMNSKYRTYMGSGSVENIPEGLYDDDNDDYQDALFNTTRLDGNGKPLSQILMGAFHTRKTSASLPPEDQDEINELRAIMQNITITVMNNATERIITSYKNLHAVKYLFPAIHAALTDTRTYQTIADAMWKEVDEAGGDVVERFKTLLSKWNRVTEMVSTSNTTVTHPPGSLHRTSWMDRVYVAYKRSDLGRKAWHMLQDMATYYHTPTAAHKNATKTTPFTLGESIREYHRSYRFHAVSYLAVKDMHDAFSPARDDGYFEMHHRIHLPSRNAVRERSRAWVSSSRSSLHHLNLHSLQDAHGMRYAYKQQYRLLTDPSAAGGTSSTAGHCVGFTGFRIGVDCNYVDLTSVSDIIGLLGKFFNKIFINKYEDQVNCNPPWYLFLSTTYNCQNAMIVVPEVPEWLSNFNAESPNCSADYSGYVQQLQAYWYILTNAMFCDIKTRWPNTESWVRPFMYDMDTCDLPTNIYFCLPFTLETLLIVSLIIVGIVFVVKLVIEVRAVLRVRNWNLDRKEEERLLRSMDSKLLSRVQRIERRLEFDVEKKPKKVKEPENTVAQEERIRTLESELANLRNMIMQQQQNAATNNSIANENKSI